MRARIKVQSGSVNGEPNYIWIDVEITQKFDNYQYLAKAIDGDSIYYVHPEEIYTSLYDFKLYLDKKI